ncbi:hypothetical protein CJ030_MR1G002654 [Morella rubra]|uniref:Uncharacterized protein n=1 Tax=Morella rubra TaxID=262757 RepID=A0A6A1WNP4_9ROSI|nr:hypothetical protein CJ030_MR1G002654 [Morella rubra]
MKHRAHDPTDIRPPARLDFTVFEARKLAINQRNKHSESEQAGYRHKIMKVWSRALAAITVALSLISVLWPKGAQADARPLTRAPSLTASSSQAVRGLHWDEKNPYKLVHSSFRRIPSNSDPIHNK